MRLPGVVKRHVPPALLIHARAWDHYLFGAPEIRLLHRLCQSGRNSIDVGANTGIYTYFMRRHSAHVYAYEPNPELARQLSVTFDERVTVVPSALSSEAGTATLAYPVDQGVEMHGLASLSQDFADAEAVRHFEVAVRRLDDEGYDNVGFIKIDVEQHEREVLAGGMGLIAAERPNLLVEVTPLLYGETLMEVFAPLMELGYKGFFLFDGALVPLERHDPAVHNSSDNVGRRGCYVGNVMFTTAHWA